MTIASAFNEIAVAQGGTASKSGTIAGAIDALNDALAGSDQPCAQTIEQAVTLLGQHIGGGGGGGTHSIVCKVIDMGTGTIIKTLPGGIVETELVEGAWVAKDDDPVFINEANAGKIIAAIVVTDGDTYQPGMYGTADELSPIGVDVINTFEGFHAFVMPDADIVVLYTE